MSLLSHFSQLQLTQDQESALNGIETFLNNKSDVFILKGYAGTGKTTLINGLVKHLTSIGRKRQLMAPTGRAAKVINSKVGKNENATTIHSAIYSYNDLIDIKADKGTNTDSFKYLFKLNDSIKEGEVVYIIDEASMISNVYNEGEFFRFGSGKLLSDLIEFTRCFDTTLNTKIIFIGDPAQLPPIGMNTSPALDEDFLANNLNLKVELAEMKQVVRQANNNSILTSASKIRKCLTSGFFNDFDLKEDGINLFNPDYTEFLNTYNSCIGRKIIIAYSNKACKDLNATVRTDKFGADKEIQVSDIIIVGKNNRRHGVMNGEFGIVTAVSDEVIKRTIRFNYEGDIKASVDLSWRWVEFNFPYNTKEEQIVKGYILENFLNGDKNNISSQEQRALYIDFIKRNPSLRPKTKEFKEAIASDPFFNAISLKYGYAVTCHKSQGGEWENAFVFWDKGSSKIDFTKEEQLSAGKTNADFYRWAYTAITRASKKLYCVNPPFFSSLSKLSFINAKAQKAIESLTQTPLVIGSIILTDVHSALLDKFNITNQPTSIQDHFLKFNELLKVCKADLVEWEQKSYEIRYKIQRESELVGLKFWINGKNVFVEKQENIPKTTNSETLLNDVFNLIPKIAISTISRTTETNTTQDSVYIYPEELGEEKPFLLNIYNSLIQPCSIENITIANIENLDWRERYTFERGSEKVVLDFEYNLAGFVGRVYPLTNSCNSDGLILDLELIIKNLSK